MAQAAQCKGRSGRPVLESIIAGLASVITAFISATGHVGVAILMAIESACIPLPSEIIMPFAGYLASTGRFSLWALATAGAIGCNIGSAVAYEIGARGGRPAVERWGRRVLITRGDIDWTEQFFRRFGGITVFVCRLLPVVRTFIALPAGIARMPLLPFHLYTFVGSWIWCYLLAWIGASLGDQWDKNPELRSTFHRFDAVIVALILIAGGWFVWHRLGALRRETR
ncbi:DedA family protein [Lichenifustis flavocetrariae]|uniref:DedA family protein n=1 Tax=Lichenifustis flavocetrariae TaxID=2949735 RepID=A0AA41YU37_9HYPH|nr:DedA family protein [Lichenifustis flavocetrariae]MCW6508601.1 DedA family protein [Lichenifustis flavocetrariae]